MKLAYAYIIESEDGKVIAAFSKKDVVNAFKAIHDDDVETTFDKIEELLRAKVRRDG